jgi:hypothetical protein
VIHKAICQTSFLFFVFVLAAGCGDSDISKRIAENNKSHIQKLTNAYELYQARKGAAVKSRQELIDFIATNSTIEKNLGFMNISREDFEDYFVSQRDGEEFFVRWGIRIEPMRAAQPIVFETKGVDGVRQVCFAGATIKEPSEKEYEDWKKRGVKNVAFAPPTGGKN